MTSELKDFFHQYAVLSPAEITEFTNQFKPRRLGKGEYLLLAGSVCQELVFVQSGCLRMYYLTDDVEVSVWFAFPNSLAIELASFISQQPADFLYKLLKNVNSYTCLKID